MKKTKILVLGAHGQLGTELLRVASQYTQCSVVGWGRQEADILSKDGLEKIANANFDVLINCAAYTAVDQAESEPENCFAVNVEATKETLKIVAQKKAFYIGFSTDYVFDGESNKPYTEADQTGPLSVYGKSKLECEKALLGYDKSLVFRVTWLFSTHHKNFYTTMVSLGLQNKPLSIVDDQIGSPTAACVLAQDLLKICSHGLAEEHAGLYHYGHSGETSWYHFAKEIFSQNDMTVDVKPIKSVDFGAPAPRPAYAKLDCNKIFKTLPIAQISWKEALRAAMAAAQT